MGLVCYPLTLRPSPWSESLDKPGLLTYLGHTYFCSVSQTKLDLNFVSDFCLYTICCKSSVQTQMGLGDWNNIWLKQQSPEISLKFQLKLFMEKVNGKSENSCPPLADHLTCLHVTDVFFIRCVNHLVVSDWKINSSKNSRMLYVC